ncbi:MAG TPA: hypothetical protein VFZ44_04830 [Pyrinomonadaceae bacterium]
MADVKIFLCGGGDDRIFLSAETAGGPLSVKALVLPGGERLALAEALEVPRALVEEKPAGSGDFIFVRFGDVGVTLEAEMVFAAGGTFFGRRLSAEAGVVARLVLRIPPLSGGDPAAPFMELEVCGLVEVNIGLADFTTDVLCFRVTADGLPSSPTALKLPSLRLAVPNIGFRLPHLPLSWDFPRLPPLPWRLPALSLSRGSFPLTVSWKSARVEPTPEQVVIDVEHLRVGTEHGAIEGDLHLVVSRGRVNVAESFFHLYRPDFNNRVRIPLAEWHFDERCVGLKWNDPELNAWLRLLSPELADRTKVAAGTSVALRLMRGAGGLEEIRLDWQRPAEETKIDLPGFDITIPPISMYTLLVRREEVTPEEDEGKVTGEREWLTLLATLGEEKEEEQGDIPDGADDPDEPGGGDPEGPIFSAPAVMGLAIRAASDFTLARDDERELHRDDKRPARPLVEFKAEPQKNLSVVLFDLPLSGGGRAGFFKQLDHALRPLDFGKGAARACEPSDCHPVKLRKDDWKLTLAFDADAANQFSLPFLKKDPEPGLLENLSQRISIKGGTHFEPDFDKHRIKTRLDIDVALGGGPGGAAAPLTVGADVTLTFDWERFAFGVEDVNGFEFVSKKEEVRGEFLGLTWVFKPAPNKVLFRLVTRDNNFQLKQEPGSTLSVLFTRATSPDQPITFTLSDFVLAPGGVSVNGRVADSPARLTGINEQFRFTEGSFQIRDNRLTDFSISGAGPLPPALVGNAVASISLQFGQRGGRLELISGAAQLQGTKLLKCQGTRFQFSVDGIGLKFVNDGRYHLYFTITGTARFVPFGADDPSGPLAWLPAVELQLIECPLTGDASAIKRHVKFLIDLPKKKTFDFLGCFKMELRGIGFVPQAEEFGGDPAMELSGQVKFADGAGDVIDARIDFHSLFIGLPAPGDILPRVHLADLGVKVRTGNAFELEGTVDFLDREEIEKGIIASGFAGEGSLSIQGLPTMAASFSFIRVSRDGGRTWVRAWFIYLEARKLSLLIPIVQVYLREVGLGFGYRYTLASIKAADETEDPRELIKVLKNLSRTQGQLSRRDQWRVDLEEPGEDARWTVVLRALISQTSAAAGPLDWNAAAEKELSCLFVMDVVIALRNDLTFLMTGRAWLNTNYNDFLTNVRGLQTKPLLSGFVLLSPRRKRLLAHLASNPGAEFGDHPPLPGFLKQALAESNFSATLLIEPGLLHYELGWPNMLRWRSKLGPLTAEFRGGTIFRISRRELVIGNSFLARGSLALSAEVNLGIVGARLSAVANVAYGARYIGVIAFDAPLARSALYGAVGVEINVTVRIDFWLRIKIGFVKITLRFGFSFSINLTAFLEVGLTAGDLIGARGTATVSLNIMGRGLRFGIHVGINESAVDAARRITSEYLNIGLEATEVEPVPGSNALDGRAPAPAALPPPPGGANETASAALAAPVSQPAVASPGADAAGGDPGAAAVNPPAPGASVGASPSAATADVTDAGPTMFETPNYTLFSIPYTEADGKGSRYFVLLPGAPRAEAGAVAGTDNEAERGFLPVPPENADDVGNDFKWTMPSSGDVKVSRFNPQAKGNDNPWKKIENGVAEWKVNWEKGLGKHEVIDPVTNKPVEGATGGAVTISSLLTHAFITRRKEGAKEDDLDSFVPIGDPQRLPDDGGVLEDERVNHPSDDAFEAAVRGAAEQFEGSPNFKHPASEWGDSLKDAFSPDTSLYAEPGVAPTPEQRRMAELTQQAVEMRSLIVKQLIEGLQEYAALPKGAADAKPTDEEAKVIEGSVAFQMGLVFKTEGGTPDWLLRPGQAGEIIQRRTPQSKVPDGPGTGETKRYVKPFNTAGTSFADDPPQFQRIRQYADANTIAITWDLFWPAGKDWRAGTAPEQKEPEHHLRHYLVRRRPLTGDEREAEFTVKHVDVLHRKKDGEGDKVVRLKPRFQIVDHFNHETTEDQAALPSEGKSYLYTVIPVDVAGGFSSRPLTIIATRRPNAPPAVPADGELVVKYKLEGIEAPIPQAEAHEPERLVVTWTQPAPPADGPQIPVKATRLVFRKEATLPAGSYALDAEAQGGRAAGLPTSNARVLRTDIIVGLDSPALSLNRFVSTVEVDTLRDAGIFPAGGWRPEAWRVFIQTVSDADVESALSPVALVLQFRTREADDSFTEERRPAQLEWLAKPVIFKALPPVDEKADDGFAKVPMPTAETSPIGRLRPDADLAGHVEYQPHPLGLRCLRFEWNQGPSRAGSYPLELHAGYQLYEFDLDANTARVLDTPPADFWEQLRRMQEMEILLAEGLLTTPSDALTAQQWEAWYPSLVRRRRLREQQREKERDPRQAGGGVPPRHSEARLSPWYTWRDSYLEWPSDESLRDPEGGEATAVEVNGFMRILVADNKIVSTREGREAVKLGQDFSKFKHGQYVRITGARDPRNNGVKRLIDFQVTETVTAPKTEIKTDLIFEAGSFFAEESADGSPLGGAPPDDRVASGRMKIRKLFGSGVANPIPQWRITNDSGKLNFFRPGQLVRVRGAGLPPDGVIRKVAAPQRRQDDIDTAQKDNELSFDENAFGGELEGVLTIDTLTLSVDGTPFRLTHPLLAKLAEELRASGLKVGGAPVELALDVAPQPPEQPGDLAATLKATSPELDPYGWNILRRMGLSLTFTLRVRRTGDLPQFVDPLTIKPEDVTRDIQRALRDVLKPYLTAGAYAPHIYVEHLFQPARSTRLDDESGLASEGDLLAFIQLSLRPAVRQALYYRRFEVGTGKGGRRIRLTVNPGDAPCTLIEQTGTAAPIELPPGVPFGKDVRLPQSGFTVLLIRSVKPEGVTVDAEALKEPGETAAPSPGDSTPPPPDEVFKTSQPMHPSEWPAAVFAPPPTPWPRELPQTSVDVKVKEEWARFRRYLLRMNPAEAGSAGDPKIEFPKDENGVVALLSWLNRFFEAGGDDRSKDDDPAASGTLAGPWVAAAYPRAVSPVGVAPDAAGRLKFYQPIEDQWAHVYRYFIVPHGRYDRLWQALAQSTALFPAPAARLDNLNRLRGHAAPEGGVDVVLERIKSVAAPLVLFSGRLDPKTDKGAAPQPGKVWEVIVAKHPEQLLVERNRTLARHLSYRHVAYTLLRRFAYTPGLRELRKLLVGQGDVLKVEQAEDVYPARGGFDDYSKPEHIADPARPSADELLTLEIPERIGVFGKGALALQWDALPYFYEHRLLLVAQTSARVSPVTDLVQKDFEYVSPRPFASAEGQPFKSEAEPPPLEPQGRSLLALVELRSFWSCLPQDARERWPSERWRDDEADDKPSPPGGAGGGEHVRKLSSLPDTEVVYQLAVRRPSGLVEAVSELFFAAEPKAGQPGAGKDWKGYSVRIFNEKFITEVGQIRVPPPGAPRPLHLEARVSLTSSVSLSKGRELKARGDFTRGALNRVLLDSVEEFKFLPGRPAAGATLAEVDRFLRRWHSVRAVTHDDVILTGSLRDKVRFFKPRPEGTVVLAWTGKADDALLAALEAWAAENPQPVADVIRDIRRQVSDKAERTVITSAPQEPTDVPAPLRPFVLAGKRLLRVRAALNDDEREALRSLYPADSADRKSLERLIDDLKDRQALENFLAGWAGEQAVSGRAAFPAFAEFHERVEFPAPESCTLALIATLVEQGGRKRWTFLTEDERRELRALAADSDISFGLALRSLLEQEARAVPPEHVGGEPAPALFAEAGVGFEQLSEIADASRFELPEGNARKLEWKGLMRDEQRAVLGRWAEVSSFARTFAALGKAADEFKLTVTFDGAEPFPKQPPAVLKPRLKIEAPELSWERLELAVDEEEALSTMSEDATASQSFRDAVKEILAELRERARLVVDVAEPDWRPRPEPGVVLPEKLLVGNGRLRFHGWMSREEVRELLSQFELGRPDRETVKRLFGDSLGAGLGGGTFEVRARRGSAAARAGALGVFVEEED